MEKLPEPDQDLARNQEEVQTIDGKKYRKVRQVILFGNIFLTLLLKKVLAPDGMRALGFYKKWD